MTAALPLRAKLLYASASFGGEALSRSQGAWLLYYYAPPDDADIDRLLSPLFVGALLTVVRLVESADDALIGYWSDRTRSRLGRRVPFILAATPFWALFAFLIFTPPSRNPAATAIYLFIVLEFFYLFGTLSGGPYEALLPELARTSRDRVSIVGMRVYFGAAGAAVALVGSGILVDTIGFAAMAAVMAGIALTFRYLGLVGVWRTAARPQPPADVSLRDSLRATFSNVPFLLFLPTYVLFQVGFLMLLGLLPYYVDNVLASEEWWVSVLSAVVIGSMVASVPLFAALARRTSKREAYGLAMLGAVITFPLLFFAGFVPGIPKEVQILVTMVLVGAPLAGNFLFPAALTADIIDYDSTRTGLRREATYYGAQNFVEKTATSVSPLLLGALLLFGNSEEDPLGVRLVGPVAAAIVLGGYLVFRRYDLPDEIEPMVSRPRR